ncbi:MAG: hypothetical protein WBR29_07275 [Gammaproteobacteria bacterium]
MRASAFLDPRLLLVSAAALSGGATVLACFTAPPPDLLPPAVPPPEILHAIVQPPEGQIASLPLEFVVPIERFEANEDCELSILLDGQAQAGLDCLECPLSTFGSNVASEIFSINQPDPSVPHTIALVVGNELDGIGCTTPNSAGGDVVEWTLPASAADAGSYGDGAFPEAAPDGLPVIPEGGIDAHAVDP